MKRAALLLALVFLASGLTHASTAAPPRQGWERPLDSYSPGQLHFRFGDVDRAHPDVPFFDGVPVPMVIFYRNAEDTPMQGTVRLEVRDGALVNATELQLRAPAGGTWEAPLLVRIDGVGGTVQAHLEGHPDAGAMHSASTWPAVSVRMKELIPHEPHDPRGTRNIVGASQEVSFDAVVTNHGPRPLSGMTLALQVDNENVGTVALEPPLEPGETREIDLPERTFPLDDPRRQEASHGWQAILRSGPSGRDGPQQAYTFTMEEGRIASVLQTQGYLRVTTRPAVFIESHHVQVGEPSNVTLVAENFADEPVEATVRLTLGSGLLRLHPAWRIPGLEETLTLQPGESRNFEHRFTPRVATDLRIDAYISTDQGGNGVGHVVDMSSPVRIQPEGGGYSFTGDLGDPVTRSVQVTSDTDLPDGVLRFAVAPRHSGSYDGLVNQADLATVTLTEAPAPGLASGEAERYAFTFTPRASGMYLVVPYVEADGVVYLGELGEDPRGHDGRLTEDFYEAQSLGATVFLAKIQPHEKSPLLPLIPGLALVGGTAGLWIGRRRYVR